MTVRVGVFGTSWWADSMYLPALRGHHDAEVVGVCGRNPDRARAFAEQWEIPLATIEAEELLDAELDAVIVASSDDSHEPLSMAALDRGLHVLCEKPLSTSTASAVRMAERAAEVGVTTLVPFTYRYMPTFQYLKRLIDDGYIGRPHHLNLRYFTGYGRETDYSWRFDLDGGGTGVLGDLGPHWLHVARWLFGEVTHVGAVSTRFYDKGPRPDGSDYERGDDSVILTVAYESGAHGTLQVSSVAWEGTAFNQTHHVDVHGEAGTLYSLNDWDTVQEVRGVRAGAAGPATPMPIPEDIWGGARRDTVHHTYKDVFRSSGAMIGDFVTAVRDGVRCQPDFAEGARVQRLIELAQQSADGDGRLLAVDW